MLNVNNSARAAIISSSILHRSVQERSGVMTSLFAGLITALLIFSAGAVIAVGQRPTRPVPISVEINGQVRYANNSAPADKVLVRVEFFSGGDAGQTLTDQTGKLRV